MTSIEKAIANSRFGFGGPPIDDLRPKAGLLRDLEQFSPTAGLGSLPGSPEILPMMRAHRQVNREQREERTQSRRKMRRMTRRAAGVRLRLGVETQTPFSERLVHFWANHFAISTDKFASAPLAGAYEAEAIRPNIMGSFADLLLACERHPAMLLYLDQVRSVGPNSRRGQRITDNGRRQAGINENLAREIMELHTMGVRAGYTQEDVTQFAHALTGWSVDGLRPRQTRNGPGSMFFAPAHEPGARTVLGTTYRQNGADQAIAILDDLAAHPATAKHIATKLARHFVADDPPKSLVAKLENRFLESGGNLQLLYRELIDAPEAWTHDRRKFQAPFEWTISSFRTLQVNRDRLDTARGLLRNLGQVLWRPGSPAGFEDRATRWAAPDALYRRVEASHRLARFGAGLDARTLASDIHGGLLTNSTSTAIRRAESPVEAMALLLASPEAMWR